MAAVLMEASNGPATAMASFALAPPPALERRAWIVLEKVQICTTKMLDLEMRPLPSRCCRSQLSTAIHN
jgi:hypothetical protein